MTEIEKIKILNNKTIADLSEITKWIENSPEIRNLENLAKKIKKKKNKKIVIISSLAIIAFLFLLLLISKIYEDKVWRKEDLTQNLLHNKGTCYFPNGDVYEGEFANGWIDEWK